MEAYALLLHAALHKQALGVFKYMARLAALRAADPLGVQRVAGERLGAEVGQLLAGVRTEAELSVPRCMLRRALARRYLQHPGQAGMVPAGWHGARQARLRLRPRGVLVAFLGPDGPGSRAPSRCRSPGAGTTTCCRSINVYMGSGRPFLAQPPPGPAWAAQQATAPGHRRGRCGTSRRRLRGSLHVMADQIGPTLGAAATVGTARDRPGRPLRLRHPPATNPDDGAAGSAVARGGGRPPSAPDLLLEGDPAVVAARKQEPHRRGDRPPAGRSTASWRACSASGRSTPT